MIDIVSLQKDLGDVYIVQDYNTKMMVDIFRPEDVWDSEVGDDIPIARITYQAITSQLKVNIMRSITQAFKQYDKDKENK